MVRRLQRRDTRPNDGARPRTLAAIALSGGLAYLAWRTTTLGSGSQLAWSLPLFLAEVWSLTQLGLLTFQAWRVPVSRDGDERRHERLDIDVVVTAGDADQALLERSLVGTAALEPGGQVLVIDASSRPEIRLLATTFGATYIVDDTSPAGTAAAVHRHTTSALYAWLEAGQVPMPDMVSTVAGRFDDQRLAVVQVAVGLLNSDSLVHVRHGRDEDGLVRDVVGPGLARFGAAPWFGPGSVVRRAAIDHIGGFVTGDASAVEQALVQLHREGWRSAFETRRLVRAVAPDTLDEYLEQRRRRAVETLRVFRTTQNPLTAPDLPWRHRVSHVAAASPFTTGLRQLLVVGILVATLLSGHMPFNAPLGRIFSLWLLSAGMALVARHALGRGAMGVGDWTRHSWRTLGADIGALRVVIGQSPGTAPSGPGPHVSGVRALGRLPLLTAAVFMIDGALLARATTLVDRGFLAPFTTGGRILVVAFGLLMLAPMLDVLQVAVLRRQRRSHFRLETALAVELGGHAATTVDLAPTGVGLIMDFSPAVGAQSAIRLQLPALDGTSRVITGRAVVRDAIRDAGGRVRVGLEFVNLSDHARVALIEYCMIGHDRLGAGDQFHSDLTVAHPHQLDISRAERHHRLLQTCTATAVITGAITLLVGPVATATEVDAVEQVCVVNDDGEPVSAVTVERKHNGEWERLGATGARGCVAVAGLAPGTEFAAGYEGLRRATTQTPDVTGRVTFALERHIVRLLDTTGRGVAGADVRFYANAWHHADLTDTDGLARLNVLAPPTNIEIAFGGSRAVQPFEPQIGTVILSRVDSGSGVVVTEIDLGTGWERFVDGMEILPGRIALRLDDGSVVKTDVPGGHIFTVATGRLTNLNVVARAEPTRTTTPTTTTADPPATATAAPTPAAAPTPEPSPTMTPTVATPRPASTPIPDLRPTPAPVPTPEATTAVAATPTPTPAAGERS